MTCSTGPSPWPPSSAGHVTPARPAAASRPCHARRARDVGRVVLALLGRRLVLVLLQPGAHLRAVLRLLGRVVEVHGRGRSFRIRSDVLADRPVGARTIRRYGAGALAIRRSRRRDERVERRPERPLRRAAGAARRAVLVDGVVADRPQRRVGAARACDDPPRRAAADRRVALAREREHARPGRDLREVDRRDRHPQVAQLAPGIDAEDGGRQRAARGRRRPRRSRPRARRPPSAPRRRAGRARPATLPERRAHAGEDVGQRRRRVVGGPASGRRGRSP